ncbi:hypothetical protein LOZ51_003864 [Ophidiomyces ophidiicola]|nr:hypothetical protein LOZ54_002077 [Ophidiomyces ophidiicola]KAI1993485.1 hypothetical protein LOZ51_003864 [Ophidiomyces ophidiicola]
MADVRALLRNELASRAHTVGKSGNKRKLDSNPPDIRKKLKPTEHAELLKSEATARYQSSHSPEAHSLNTISPPSQAEADSAPPPEAATSNYLPLASQSIDEDEWAAFERDVAAPTRTKPPATLALHSNAVISAAPVSAAELAEREQEERDSNKKAREAELNGERDEATRSLEEEFDEMEQLDERVKRLKEKREEILKQKHERLSRISINSEKPDLNKRTGSALENDDEPVNREEDDLGEDDDDDDDDDDWDWRFR